MPVVKMEGNEQEKVDALAVIIGQEKSMLFTALANMNGFTLTESLDSWIESIFRGDDASVLYPWCLVRLKDRPACDRGRAGLERFLKHHKMSREEFQQIAEGTSDRWGTDQECQIAAEWLDRAKKEEQRGRSRKVDGLLRKNGITVKGDASNGNSAGNSAPLS